MKVATLNLSPVMLAGAAVLMRFPDLKARSRAAPQSCSSSDLACGLFRPEHKTPGPVPSPFGISTETFHSVDVKSDGFRKPRRPEAPLSSPAHSLKLANLGGDFVKGLVFAPGLKERFGLGAEECEQKRRHVLLAAPDAFM